jgi:hypothetical protein
MKLFFLKLFAVFLGGAFTVSCSDFYVEPAETAPHAKIIRVEEEKKTFLSPKHKHTTVKAIDDRLVNATKGQFFGAWAQAKEIRVTPGKHEIFTYTHFSRGWGDLPMEAVGSVKADFKQNRTYSIKSTLSGTRVLYSIIDVATSKQVSEPAPAFDSQITRPATIPIIVPVSN